MVYQHSQQKKVQRLFSVLVMAVIAIETMTKTRTFLSHPWAEKTLPLKNEKFFVKDFFLHFSLAIIAIENAHDEGRKQNFSISPMGGVMVYQTLPAEKMKNFCQRFFHFSLAVIAIENNDEGRKQNFSISPMGGVMVYQTLPAEKNEKNFVKDFFRFSLAVIAIENEMTKAENRTFLSHPWAELWCTKPSHAEKMKKFCQRFFSF